MKLYLLSIILVVLYIHCTSVECAEKIAVPGTTNCHLGQAIAHMFEQTGMTMETMDRVKVEVCKRCDSCCRAIDLIEKTVDDDKETTN